MAPRTTYPFTAIVGQEKMKLALVLNVINPGLSGVLIRGEKGTAKSTAVRALAEILPEISVVAHCPFQLARDADLAVCGQCHLSACRERRASGRAECERRRVRVIDLPVGATEDRVVGTLDMETALREGQKRFEPGILAAAHRGILYVDEVNLLDDHIVDVLLDAAAMGVVTVEREGISFSHPARFTLVGTMNPEEGELRPQLLDRFGLCVQIEGIREPEARVTVMERRAAFDESPQAFCDQFASAAKDLAERMAAAAALYPRVEADRNQMLRIATRCLEVGVDGHRADIIMLKTAKTHAAYQGRTRVDTADVDMAADLVLPHRLRRQPLQSIGNGLAR